MMTAHDTTHAADQRHPVQNTPTVATDPTTPAQLTADGWTKTTLKTCSKCNAVHPATLEFWHSDRHQKDNLSTICKSCRQAFDRVRDPIRNRKPNRQLSRRVASQNRRAISAGVAGRLTRRDILRQYTVQNGLCYWCNTPLDNQYDIDHIKPFSHGGDNTPGNVVCSCRRCNSSKSDKKPYIWLGVLASMGIAHPDKPDTMPVQLSLFDQLNTQPVATDPTSDTAKD